MRRIGFLTLEHPRASGGIASYLRAILPELRSFGWEPVIISLSGTEEDRQEECHTIVSRSGNFHWYLGKIPLLRSLAVHPIREYEWSRAFIKGIQRATEEHMLDLLEVHEPGASCLHQSGIPYVVRLHGSAYAFRKHAGERMTPDILLSHRLEVRAMKRASAISSPSRSYAAELLNTIAGKRKVHVIPNPVDNELLKEGKKADVALGSTVVYLGRMAPVKGVEDLLSVARIVAAEIPSFRLVMAGPWQMPKPPAAYGLDSSTSRRHQIEWIGPVDRSRVIRLLHAAAVVVVPSRFESFGISCLEAMAFGRPVVASQVGGIPEIIQHDVTGLLAPAGNPAAFAHTLIDLLTDTRRMQRLGEAGKLHVREGFTPEIIARRTVELYDRIFLDSRLCRSV